MSDLVTARAARAGETGSEIARMLASFLWVLAATAGSLAVLGALPVWITGDQGPGRAATIQEAERRLGARVLVPGYFPARLAWPPAEIRVAGGRHGSVHLTFACKDGGSPVELLQAIDPGVPISADLLEARTVLKTDRTSIAGEPASLSEVLVHGVRTRELAWDLQGRSMILRSAGDLEELFRMARTAHREGGR
jgi:hypothetical protein